jgi:hypothetical protein
MEQFRRRCLAQRGSHERPSDLLAAAAARLHRKIFRDAEEPAQSVARLNLVPVDAAQCLHASLEQRIGRTFVRENAFYTIGLKATFARASRLVVALLPNVQAGAQ